MEIFSAGVGAALTQDAPMVQPLGQFLDSYILARDERGLLIVDQHVAHERVLFEKILRGAVGAPASSQKLLTPLTIELSMAEREIARGSIDSLCAAGFVVEEFGEGALLLRGLPAGLERSAPDSLVREILSDLREGEMPAAPEQRRRAIAASAACHAAIKVHFPLNVEKMAWLLGELFRCETPTTCPHGRPIILRIDREEIESGFGRR